MNSSVRYIARFVEEKSVAIFLSVMYERNLRNVSVLELVSCCHSAFGFPLFAVLCHSFQWMR